jgi:2-polyprenyl-3-methyl-5-hydroxy-6-metoxy-1,4-benzoquinol methylase
MKPQDLKPEQTLSFLLERIPELNNEQFKTIAFQTMDHYKGSKKQRQQTLLIQELENKWYDSLEKNQPAYHYYEMPEMVLEVWCCFHLYSKKYLQQIDKLNLSKQNIKTIVDVGCGVGFSSSFLKHIFPNANVYGTQVRGSQFNIATELGQINGFNVIENIAPLEKVDFVFASEYFEHFERPIEHLLTILEKSPNVLVIANSFGSRSFGHFNHYKHNDKIITNKSIGKSFNEALRHYGYKQHKTGFWNNRPAVWTK